jgi:hypothetical protein
VLCFGPQNATGEQIAARGSTSDARRFADGIERDLQLAASQIADARDICEAEAAGVTVTALKFERYIAERDAAINREELQRRQLQQAAYRY